ncbi:MAG: hypothetical protein OXP75_18485 [Rhodospirillales bacterium]|nr:hypothetical protein [Rhodospirillales bacterium]
MMRTGKQILACAVLACALAFAAAVQPAAAALAAVEEGAPAPAARTIPVAPVDPGSTAGRIVLGVADWLEQRLGSGSQDVRLALDAPMWAEERDGTYILHLPGARLVEPSVPLVQWALGDLAVAVKPQGETTYDFETTLPPVIDKGEERLTIGEGTVSGTWRSDLEVTTRLEASATNLRLSKGEGAAAVEAVSVGAITLADEVAEGSDGLWDGLFSFALSDLAGESFHLGRLEASGSFEDFDRDLALHMHGDFGALTGGMGGPTALADLLTPLMDSHWGRSEMTIALHDLTATGDDAGLGNGGTLSLGRLEWHVDLDGRAELTDLATRIAAADLRLGGAAAAEIPPALMPRAATLDIALTRLPVRRIADALSGLAKRDGAAQFGDEPMMEVILDHLDAADSTFEIRDIHIVTRSCEFRAEGRLQVEPASVFGVIGRLDARVRGLSALMALAVAEGEEDVVALLIALQGLGRPVFEEGEDKPAYAFEIDLRRDGAVTVNGIPFDMLPGAPSPQ